MIVYPNCEAVEVSDWNALAEFFCSNTEDGIYYVLDNGLAAYVKFQGLEYLNESSFILVGFSGAVKNSGLSQGPLFSFSGIADKINVPLISFSDPSLMLDSKVTLGWYLGNRYIPNYPEKVSSLLDRIFAKLGKNMVLSGGSGGGFAALNISNMMYNKSNIISVVWNPQIVINNYYKNAVDRYIESSWGDSENDIKNVKVTPEGAKSVFLMDGFDHMHIRRHLRFYLEKQGKPEKNNNNYVFKDSLIVVGDWGKGHTPPPKDLITNKILEASQYFAQFEDYNKDSFDKKVLDFSEENLHHFKRFIKPVVSFFGSCFMLEVQLNSEYIGYQLKFDVVNNLGVKVLSSSWLRNFDNCRAFGDISEFNNIGDDLKDWEMIVIIEDFLGLRKRFTYKFSKVMKKYQAMNKVI